MTAYNLPEARSLSDLLTMVIGDSPAISEAEPSTLDGYSHRANFVDDQDQLVAQCYADLPLSAALGAALSMIPPAVAAEMVAEGELTPIASDNLYEIMNMLSSLYMDDKTPHLRLTQVDVLPGEPAPFEPVSRSDFEITAGSYGQGRIAFLTH